MRLNGYNEGRWTGSAAEDGGGRRAAGWRAGLGAWAAKQAPRAGGRIVPPADGAGRCRAQEEAAMSEESPERDEGTEPPSDSTEQRPTDTGTDEDPGTSGEEPGLIVEPIDWSVRRANPPRRRGQTRPRRH